MNQGDIFEIEIENMSYGPSAIGRLKQEDQKPLVIFVEGAIPGEKVKVRLTKQFKNFWEAELIEVLVPSKHRKNPPCPVATQCGGCQWQHIEYSHQVELKKQVLLQQLSRATKQPMANLEALLEVKAATSEFGYRNRVQVRGDKNGIGFFAKKSHQIVHTDRCIVADPQLQKKWTEFLKEEKHLELAKDDGVFKLEWTLNSNKVFEAINEKHAANGFNQINDAQNEVLKNLVQKAVWDNYKETPEGVLLDLYGGSGNLSKQFEGRFDQVLCVDSFNDGVKVERFLQQKKNELLNCSVVVADPPREGLKRVSKQVADLKAKVVVLVSCDPSTLARDLNDFLPFYQINKIVLIDLFPQTFHIESVVTLIHSI